MERDVMMMSKMRMGAKARSTVAGVALASLMALGSVVAPSAASATTVVNPPPTISPCTNFTFNVTITACAGGYSKNLLQTSLTDATGIAALSALGAPTTGIFLEPKLDNLNSTTGIINFNQMLYGQTVFAFHAGGGGDGKEGTFFFSFDAGTGTDIIQISDRLNSNATGLSNAALFQTGMPVSAVPEPATWAMMLMGFAGVGASLRRRRKPVLAIG